MRRAVASARQCPHAALQACWEAPLPRGSARLSGVDFLVCDSETSGLDPRSAELLSMGWVKVSEGEIHLSSAEHHLLRPRLGVGHSATIHQLRDVELRSAETVPEVLQRFLRAALGRVLVFHHAPLDMAFIDAASREYLGAPLLLPCLDTLQLERRYLARRDRPPASGELRLATCRERCGLAPHGAHNALADALATAELFLAQIARSGPNLRLRDLC